MTFELEKTGAKLALVALVLGAGLVGGLAAELLKTRKIGGVEEEGGVERPFSLTARYYDLGWIASVFLGMVAAALAMGIFQPIDEVAKSVKGATTGAAGGATDTVHQYDLWRVVAIALAAGFSAPKFLALAQERLLATVSAARFETTITAAKVTNDNAPADSGQAHRAAIGAILDSGLKPRK